MFMRRNIENLFLEGPVLTTPQVARFFELSEADARVWARELHVSKVGASYAWSEDDVRRLEEELEGDDDEELDGEEDDDEELDGEEDDDELDDDE
jgi:hypothetical protein